MHGHCYQIYCALYILHPSVSSLPISWPGGWFSPTAPKWLPTACMRWRPLTFTSVVEQRHSHSQQTLPKRERAADTNWRCNKSRFWVKKGWVVVNKRLTCPTSWRLYYFTPFIAPHSLQLYLAKAYLPQSECGRDLFTVFIFMGLDSNHHLL